MKNTISLSNDFLQRFLNSDLVPEYFNIGGGRTIRFNKQECRIENDKIVLSIIEPGSAEIVLSDFRVETENVIKFDWHIKGILGTPIKLFINNMFSKPFEIVRNYEISLSGDTVTVMIKDFLFPEIPVVLKSIKINNSIEVFWE